jgi:hypothetical protein
MEKSALHLSEQILALRAAASSIYDRGYALGEKPEVIAETIKPLQNTMKKIIESAAHKDLPGCVLAVQRLESQAKAHEDDAKFLMDKATNARHHSANVKRAVIFEMKKNGVTEQRVGDFTLTLVQIDGKDDLILK